MSLRLALTIEGDASGAKKALDDTAQGIDNLGRKAGAAAGETDRSARAVAALGDNAAAAAPALKGVGDSGAVAAKGIIDTGSAAGAAAGSVAGFARSVAGLAVGLGAGLAIGALTTAVTGLVGAVASFVTELVDPSGRIERALKSHAGLIDDIRKKYGEAARGVEDYGRRSAAVLRFEAQQDVSRLEREAPAAASSAAGSLQARRVTVGTAGGSFGVPEDFGPFTDAVAKFRQEARAGTADVNQFRREIAEIAGSLPKGDPFREIAEGIVAATDPASKLQSELGRARDAVKGLEGDIPAAAAALGTLPKGFDEAGAAAERNAQSLAEFRAELERLGGGGSISAPAGAIGQPDTFAAGGVVDRPTLFRFGAGQLGLMGEAGPEAILPLDAAAKVGAIGRDGREGSLSLARLASGKLGVKTFADGGVVGAGLGGGGVIGAVTSSLGGFVRALMRGKDESEAFSQAMLQLSARVTELALNNVLKGLFGGAGGGFLSSLFSGGFADGGFIPPGRWGIAGERGAEPVFGGSTGVTVFPAATGQPVNHFHIQTPNPRAFAEDRVAVLRGVNRVLAQAARFS